MGITVEFKDYAEMITFARVLLAGPDTPDMIPVKKLMKQETRVLPSESETSMSNAPEGIDIPDENVEQLETEEATAPVFTLEQVRAKLTELSRAGKQKEVKAILDSFSAKNVTALDPKDYTGVMEKAGVI